MSIRALNWALTVKAGNHANKLVLFMLADRHNEDHDAAWPSIGWLANATEMSRRTVQRALNDLEQQGLIIPSGTAGRDPRYQTKRYRLPMAVDNPTIQGRQGDTRDVSGVSSTTLRGVNDDIQGCQGDTQTYREPLGNRAARNRRRLSAVDNTTRAPVPTPEETLRMLEEERA